MENALPTASTERMISRPVFAGIAALIFFMVGIILAYPSLSYYWFNDDLIMVRMHSGAEIAQAFTGDWESSGISTPGYRPLTLLFNHMTALAFGESVELHRLFRIALFALHLTVLGLIGLELRLSRLQVLLAGLIILCTKNTWWVLVWAADGIHAFNVLLVGLAAYLLLRDLKHPSPLKWTAAYLLFAGALLTREDVLTFVVIIPLIGLFQSDAPRRRIIVQAIGLAMVAIGYWVLRTMFVPSASTSISIMGWVYSLAWIFLPRLAFLPLPVWIGVLVAFWAILFILLRTMHKDQRRLAWLWLVCTVIAASTGLVITRANTLFPALSFFGLFLATILGDALTRSRRLAVLGGIALVVFVVGSAAQHRIAQQSLAPNSTEYLVETSRYFWGEWSPAYPFIPEVRREYLQEQLASYGVNSMEDYEARLPELLAAGTWFEPADDWLSGW